MSGYGFKHVLAEAVPDAGTVSFAAPGSSNPNCQLDKATLAVGAQVLAEGQFSVAADAPASKGKSKKAKAEAEAQEGEAPPAESITVTNSSGSEWEAGAELYVGTPGFSMSDVTGDNAQALAAQVEANTSAIAALDARVAALEAASPV